ncbi:MAG: hypothetical protein CMJ81_21145 [Planctomycetaceae bacterium]|nr:hypothetical protein [Planctomycetaceae bacterium]
MKKFIFALVVILTVVISAPTLAEDGQVPKTTLNSLQLGDMQQMSDAEGSQIRGQFSPNGSMIGMRLIFFQLLTPDSRNFVTGKATGTFIGDSHFGGPISAGSKNLSKAHLVGVGAPVTLDIGSWLVNVIGSKGESGMMKVGF